MAESRKTVCPVTGAQFMADAKPVHMTATIQGKTVEFMGMPKVFSTGSFGWNINDKATVLVDGKPTMLQVGINITCIASKDAPRQ